MILLTATQANRVRGLTIIGHALAPVPLANGRYVLPEEVLTDPAHKKYWNILSTFPTVADDQINRGTRQDPNDPNSPIINSDFEQDPVKTRAAAYSEDWAPGVTIAI